MPDVEHEFGDHFRLIADERGHIFGVDVPASGSLSWHALLVREGDAALLILHRGPAASGANVARSSDLNGTRYWDFEGRQVLVASCVGN